MHVYNRSNGNIKQRTNLLLHFLRGDTLDINNEFNSTFLETIGKVGTTSDLKALLQ